MNIVQGVILVTSSSLILNPWCFAAQNPHANPTLAGDVLNDGDVIAQIETDKVTIDVRYTEAKPGKLKELLVAADDTVTVGQPVCTVEQVRRGTCASGDGSRSRVYATSGGLR